MSDDLRLGFHRLGRWFEDGLNMGVGIALAWAAVVLILAIATAAGASLAFALIILGGAVLLLLRDEVAKLARKWRRGRVQLEQGRAN
jgi:hypothetical protein